MEEIISFQEYVLKLKRIKRKGWLLKKIPDAESVADHSFSTSVLVMIMAEKLKLNMEKCLKMSLLHDLAEAKIEDITPHDDISTKEKYLMEKKAINEIIKKTNIKFIEIIWEEYSENKTQEAKLVHDMDKIEMLIQALDYEKRYSGKNLEEFFNYVKDKLQLKETKELYNLIMKKRQN